MDIGACRASRSSPPASSSHDFGASDANTVWTRAKLRADALEKFLAANQRWLDRVEQRIARR